MARGKAGGPKSQEPSGYSHLRVHADLAEMIGWIHRLKLKPEKKTIAQYIDRLIRDEVESDYDGIQARVEAIKKLEAEQEPEPKPKKRKDSRPAS